MYINFKHKKMYNLFRFDTLIDYVTSTSMRYIQSNPQNFTQCNI